MNLSFMTLPLYYSGVKKFLRKEIFNKLYRSKVDFSYFENALYIDKQPLRFGDWKLAKGHNQRSSQNFG